MSTETREEAEENDLQSLERSLTAAEAERDALRARVAGLEEWMRNNLDDYEEASSGYIPGCGSDLKWRARHDEAVAEARALLAPSSSEVNNGNA